MEDPSARLIPSCNAGAPFRYQGLSFFPRADPPEKGVSQPTAMKDRKEEKDYSFEGEVVVSKFFNGLVYIERSGVPNGI
ncbi:hypothetical protein YTPLAS72_06160 [Nitrospira sp.]|nr:hypothetical protein YTPLAS72_06160 [Nitrospira sp.]